jgi:hypothetical protein
MLGLKQRKLRRETMKRYLLLTITGLLALVVCGGAQVLMPWDQVPCSNPIYVNPGETVLLNGTEVPPVTIPATTVEYAWTFVDSNSNEYPVVYHVNDTIIPQPWDGAYLNFSAPTDAGCYKAWLTVWFNRTVAAATTLEEDCISQDCYQICVNETECPLCDNISCWEVAPTCPATECPAKLCLANFSSGLTVWYNVTMKSDGSPVHNYSDCGDGYCDGCVCIDWKNDNWFANETYVVTLHTLGPDGVEYFNCTGNVSVVETPVANIRRIPNS